MPYIDQVSRNLFSSYIASIAERIGITPTQRPGEMNYIVSALIRKVYGEHPKYADYNEIIGFLEAAKLELYRTRVGPYEQKKEIENGPIYNDTP